MNTSTSQTTVLRVGCFFIGGFCRALSESLIDVVLSDPNDVDLVWQDSLFMASTGKWWTGLPLHRRNSVQRKEFRKFFDMNPQTIGFTQLLKQAKTKNPCRICFKNPMCKLSMIWKLTSKLFTISGPQQIRNITTTAISIFMTCG